MSGTLEISNCHSPTTPQHHQHSHTTPQHHHHSHIAARNTGISTQPHHTTTPQHHQHNHTTPQHHDTAVSNAIAQAFDTPHAIDTPHAFHTAHSFDTEHEHYEPVHYNSTPRMITHLLSSSMIKVSSELLPPLCHQPYALTATPAHRL